MSSIENLPSAEGLAARRTTPDYVADLLRDAILTGRLEDGAELNQVALAEHFSVSRVPIREALRQLQAEGLVRQEAHRRAVVTTLSSDHIEELFDLRVLLETYMLRRSIEAMDDATLEHLEKYVASMDEMTDHEEWLAANREFHHHLYLPSGAVYTQELTARIAARTTRYLYLRSGGAGLVRQEEAHREHAEILEAVRARDIPAATAALTHHIEGTRAGVRQFLTERS